MNKIQFQNNQLKPSQARVLNMNTRNGVVQDESDEASGEHARAQEDGDNLVDNWRSRVDGAYVSVHPLGQNLILGYQ